jgi:hypothetical protein
VGREKGIGITGGEFSGYSRSGRSIAELGFREAVLAAGCIEHQIEAATLDAFARHLHTEHRMLEQLGE